MRVRTFSGPDGLVVELHWAIMPWWWAADLRVQDLSWEFVDVGGRSVPHLRPADLLVTLCAHGGKHRWHRLLWVADVAALIRARADLDWDRAATLSRNSGTRRALIVGLSVARHLLGLPLPASAQQLVDDDETGARCAAAIAERFFSDRWPPQGTGRGRYAFLQWQLKERWRDRVRYVAGRTFGRPWFVHGVGAGR